MTPIKLAFLSILLISLLYAVNGTGTSYSVEKFGLAATGATESGLTVSLRERADYTPAFNIGYNMLSTEQAHVGFFNRLIYIPPVPPTPPTPSLGSYHRTVDTSLIDQSGIGYIGLLALSVILLIWKPKEPKNNNQPKDTLPISDDIMEDLS